MFRQIASSVVVLFLMNSAGSAMASDEIAPARAAAEKRATQSTTEVLRLELVEAPRTATRGALLPSLYVTLGGLNAYDAYSTTRGTARLATESNGVVGGAAGSPVAMWAIKGGVTVGSIVVSERLWRSGHRAQAVGMMIAANSLMAVVGARNSSMLRNQR